MISIRYEVYNISKVLLDQDDIDIEIINNDGQSALTISINIEADEISKLLLL